MTLSVTTAILGEEAPPTIDPISDVCHTLTPSPPPRPPLQARMRGRDERKRLEEVEQRRIAMILTDENATEAVRAREGGRGGRSGRLS